ncbi:unnamed protein product [Absidia cylindrospora]
MPTPTDNTVLDLRLEDMPFLVGAREKPDRPRTLVMKSAKAFITRLEELNEPTSDEREQFSNTPKQRVRNTIAWTELTPRDDESGEDFFHRLQDAADVFELEKISVDALAFFSVYSNFGRTWRYKIMDAINVRDGTTPFFKKTFKAMCIFAAELDLDPREQPTGNRVHDKRQLVDDHREPREPRSQRGSWNDFKVGNGLM